MSRKVVLVGHCGPDSAYLRSAVSRIGRDVEVLAADDSAELDRLIEQGVDLLLVNRVLDYGFADTDGPTVIGELHDKYPDLKMMLVSNYPDAQAQAVAAGALPGFGKRQLGTEPVNKLLREALGAGSGV